MSVKNEINKLGAAIVKDAINNAKPNKKTGRLERSISYSVTGSDENATISISEETYGKFLNNQTKFMDKAVNNNIDKGAKAIANAVADDIIKDLTKNL